MPPDLGIERIDKRKIDLVCTECAIGFDAIGEIGGRQHAARRRFKCGRKVGHRGFGNRQSRCHCVPAKFCDQLWLALGDEIKCIAHVKAANRSSRTLQLAILVARKGDYRAVIFLTNARGQNADYALVPIGVEQCERIAIADINGVERRERLVLHAAFDAAPLTIQLIEFGREFQRNTLVGREQTLDAERHIVQPARRV